MSLPKFAIKEVNDWAGAGLTHYQSQKNSQEKCVKMIYDCYNIIIG